MHLSYSEGEPFAPHCLWLDLQLSYWNFLSRRSGQTMNQLIEKLILAGLTAHPPINIHTTSLILHFSLVFSPNHGDFAFPQVMGIQQAAPILHIGCECKP